MSALNPFMWSPLAGGGGPVAPPTPPPQLPTGKAWRPPAREAAPTPPSPPPSLPSPGVLLRGGAPTAPATLNGGCAFATMSFLDLWRHLGGMVSLSLLGSSPLASASCICLPICRQPPDPPPSGPPPPGPLSPSPPPPGPALLARLLRARSLPRSLAVSARKRQVGLGFRYVESQYDQYVPSNSIAF